MEEYERACCIQGYRGYKVTDCASARPCPRYPSPLACLQGQSLALADNYPWDPEDHPSTQRINILVYYLWLCSRFLQWRIRLSRIRTYFDVSGNPVRCFCGCAPTSPCVMNETRLTLLFSHSTFFAILPLLWIILNVNQTAKNGGLLASGYCNLHVHILVESIWLLHRYMMSKRFAQLPLRFLQLVSKNLS